MTTFIDKDTGAEYEQVIDPKIGDYSEEDTVVLRPVKEEPKWQIELLDTLEITIHHDFTEDQAQLIKGCVSELMEVISIKGRDVDLVAYPPLALLNRIDEARNALSKGSE